MKSSAKRRVTGSLATLALSLAAGINRVKKTWLGARHALVIGFFLPAGMAAAQNLATNPGFETGNTTGWTTMGSPTISAQTLQVHSGSYAGLVTNRTATWNGIAQSFQGVLQANQTYNISAWVRLVSGASQTMQLTIQKVDGSGTGYSSFGSSSVSSTSWSQLSGQYTFTPSGTLTSLVLYAEMPSNSTNAYYLDDLLVQSVNTTTGQCIVDWTNVFQRIDGFGASSAWRGTWTTNQANMFFSTSNNIPYTNFDKTIISTNNGIGLSLLRNHIYSANTTSASDTPTTTETSIMQMAQNLGARVWSAPWTPASGFKNNNAQDGGTLLTNTANYQAYASQLANYVVSMKNSYSINLYAISIQNEPDANVTTYESCNWNAQQIHDFTTNLYNALVASNVNSTKIMLPESQNWQDPSGLTVTAMSDSTSNMVGIIADHNYDGATGPTTLTKNNYGKALWETEVSLLSGSDSSITNGVYYGQRIYQFMTVAQANAFHYWWLIPANSTSNQGLMDTNANPTPRMFVFGQYSRFVRPGYYRIGANNTGTAFISAYNDTKSGNFAIVAVNTNSTAINQTFNLTNFNATSVTPWMTTSNLSLASQSPVTVTSSSFTCTLPALSVVTFVGQNVSGPAPATTAVTLTSGANPSTYGNAVTFTATLKTNGVAVGNISGETVTFYDGTTSLGTGTLNSSGQAAYISTATQLAATSHSLTAVYGGDTAYAGSTNSPALSQTVNPATLTYTANATNLTYGSAVPALTGSVSGFVGSDTQANATTGTLAFTTPATSSSGVASYAINGSGLTANNGNYTFTQAAGNATALTIKARPVNLTGSRPYDGTTTAAAGILSVANKVGSDNVTVASGSGTLAGANVGLEAISSFGTLALGGTAVGNYTLSGASGLVNILPLVTPTFAAQGISAGTGGWQLSFSAQAGQTYQVLIANDLTLPLNLWTVLTNGTCGAGTVTITDNSTNLPFRFYRIVSP